MLGLNSPPQDQGPPALLIAILNREATWSDLSLRPLWLLYGEKIVKVKSGIPEVVKRSAGEVTISDVFWSSNGHFDDRLDAHVEEKKDKRLSGL